MSKSEGKYAGEFLASEAQGTRSRDAIIVALSAALLAGTVLGRVPSGSTATAVANAGNTGNGAMGAIVVAAPAKLGVYKLTIIEPAANAGAFRVEDPDGVEIGTGNVAAAFNKGGLSFTLADGAADFVAGDGFAITVVGTAFKYKQMDPAAVDGSQIAAGILYDAVDASAADAAGVAVARDAEVVAADLVWIGGITANQKAAALAQLAALGIIAR